MGHPNDARAEGLLAVGWNVATRIRDEDPTDVRRSVEHLSVPELRDLVLLLAACLPLDKPRSELLAWWDNQAPATAQVAALSPCGTQQAYQRHLAHNEAPDPLCMAAHHSYREGMAASAVRRPARRRADAG